MVIEFHPETTKKVEQFFLRKSAVIHLSFVHSVKMLVEPSRIERIPWVELGYPSKMNKPVMLQHLMDSFWSICRNSPANGSHFEKLFPSDLIRLPFRKRFQCRG